MKSGIPQNPQPTLHSPQVQEGHPYFQLLVLVLVVGPDPGFKHLAGPAPLVKQGRSRVP